jgi:hypothetical protein
VKSRSTHPDEEAVEDLVLAASQSMIEIPEIATRIRRFFQ